MLRAGWRRRPRAFRFAVVVVAATASSPAAARSAAQELRPHESPSEPPPAPLARPRPTSPAVAIRAGEFESVQVNVDAAGLNVVGDAANEPTIAVSPIDRRKIAVGWRQFDSIASDFRQAGLNVSFDGGRSWEEMGVLAPGLFGSDPVLAAGADGTFHYLSLQVDKGDYWTELHRSLDDLTSWEAPAYAYGGDKEWLTVDTTQGPGRGHLYQAWSQFGCCGSARYNRSIDGGESFETPVPGPSYLAFGTTAVGPTGDLWIAGTTNYGTTFAAFRSTNAGDPGETLGFDLATPLDLGGELVFDSGSGPNPAGLLGQVWIEVDRSNGPRRGWIYALATVDPPGGDPHDLHFIRSENGGATWSAPLRVNDDSETGHAWQWFGTLSVAPDGRIDAIWNDTRDASASSLDSELYYSFSADGGTTWSTNVALSAPFDPELGWPIQEKLGDYYDMVSDRVGADVVYAATFLGEQNVYYLRIGDRDCNDNGVGDAADLSAGFDVDLDGGGIPDRCEADGDGDGAVDALDNCVAVPNRDQDDGDDNGAGDACQIFNDGFEGGDVSSWA